MFELYCNWNTKTEVYARAFSTKSNLNAENQVVSQFQLRPLLTMPIAIHYLRSVEEPVQLLWKLLETFSRQLVSVRFDVVINK